MKRKEVDEIKLLDVILSNTAGNRQKTIPSSQRNPEFFHQLQSALKNRPVAGESAMDDSEKQNYQDEQELMGNLLRLLSALRNENEFQPVGILEDYRTKDIFEKEFSNSQKMPSALQQLLQPKRSIDRKYGFVEPAINDMKQFFSDFTQEDFQVLSELFHRLAESSEMTGDQTQSGKSITEDQPIMQPADQNTGGIDFTRQGGEELSEPFERLGENPVQGTHTMAGSTSDAAEHFSQQDNINASAAKISQEDVMTLFRLFASLANEKESPGNFAGSSLLMSRQPRISPESNIGTEAKSLLQLFSSFMKNAERMDQTGESMRNGFLGKSIREYGLSQLLPEQGLPEAQHPETLVKSTNESNQTRAVISDIPAAALKEINVLADRLSRNEKEIVDKLLSSMNGEKKEIENKPNLAFTQNGRSNGMENKQPLFFHLNHSFYGHPGSGKIGNQAETEFKASEREDNQVQPLMQMNKSSEQHNEPVSSSKQKPVLPDQIIAAWKQARFTPFGKLTGSFTIRLHPEHLGHLTIKINKQHGQMTGRIIASSESAKELLEHHLPLLKQALPNMPMQIERFTVPLQEGSQLLMQEHYGEGESHSRQREQDRWPDDEENEPFQHLLDELKIEQVLEDRRRER